MKQTVFIIFFIHFSYILSAQNISVRSFSPLPNDMTARVDAPKLDQNGEKCALIKVVTSEEGFGWEGGSLGIVAAEKKMGEYWVYVPRGARRITIKHNKLGILRNYAYPIAIESAMVYEMRLTTARIVTSLEEPEILSEWLIITSEPSDADVYLDKKFMGKTPFQKMVEVGKHQYRVAYSMYNALEGEVELNTSDGRMVLDLKLTPAYGSINIKSYPEEGMNVFIDEQNTNRITPCILNEISSGDHIVTLRHTSYEPKSIEVTVFDDSTTYVEAQLSENYAFLDLKADKGTYIYLDNKLVGKDQYQSKIIPGIYQIEFKKEGFKNQLVTKKVENGDTLAFTSLLQPYSGKLNIITMPYDAVVRVNGEYKGTSPILLPDVIAGKVEVEVSKEGYLSEKKIIDIKDSETTDFKCNLKEKKDQEYEKDTKTSRFALYLEASPNYAYSSYSSLISNATKDGEFYSEYAIAGYSFSIKTGIYLSGKIQLVTGLEYNNKGYCAETYIYRLLMDDLIESQINFMFLEIPLYFKYQFFINKFKLSPVVGVSYGRLIRSEIWNDKNLDINLTNQELSEYGFQRNIFNAHIGIELSYMFNKHFGLKIEPKFDYAINELVDDYSSYQNWIDFYPEDRHLYIIGANIGLVVKL